MRINKWLFKLEKTSIFVILIGICINLTGRQVTNLITVPFWFDAIGTIYSAAVLGPIAGMIVGFISNLSYGLLINPFSVVYVIVNMLIGLYIGIFYSEENNDFFQTMIVAMALCMITIAVCTPINIVVYDGYVGNKWGDACVAMLQNGSTGPVSIVNSLLGEIFVDFPDKVLSMFIANGLVIISKKTFLNKSKIEEKTNEKGNR